jgi:magnesium transporter
MRKIKYKKGRKPQVNVLEYTGLHRYTEVEMQLFVYDKETISEFENTTVFEIEKSLDFTKNNWINVHGLNKVDLLKELAERFEFDN